MVRSIDGEFLLATETAIPGNEYQHKFRICELRLIRRTDLSSQTAQLRQLVHSWMQSDPIRSNPIVHRVFNQFTQKRKTDLIKIDLYDLVMMLLSISAALVESRSGLMVNLQQLISASDKPIEFKEPPGKQVV